MLQYLNILRNILENGKPKSPTRVMEGGRKLSHDTIGLPNQIFTHDMSEGFPLLTCRKVPYKSTFVELEGFIKGITDKRWYQERFCKYWDEWSNPQKVSQRIIQEQEKMCKQFPDKSMKEIVVETTSQDNVDKIKKEENDLGPIYGRQWRRFDEIYGSAQYIPSDKYPGQGYWKNNGVNHGTDQLQSILDTLKKNPTDRRMICSAWNPNQFSMMALPPCHYSWGVTLYDDRLHMIVNFRSWDFYLGASANIPSYALLLSLLSKHADVQPGNLTIIGLDTHLYTNQIEVAKELLTREPRELPTIELLNENFWDWDHTKVKLNNYNPHPPTQKIEVVI